MRPGGFVVLRGVVAESYGVTVPQIAGTRTWRKLAHPRQMLACLCRDALGMTFPQIGQLMKQDHTTAMYGWRKARERLEHDEAQQRIVRTILREYAKRMTMEGRA